MSNDINREMLHGSVKEFTKQWLLKNPEVLHTRGLIESILKDFIDEQFCVQVTGRKIDRHFENWWPTPHPTIQRIWIRRFQRIGVNSYVRSSLSLKLPPNHVYPTK